MNRSLLVMSLLAIGACGGGKKGPPALTTDQKKVVQGTIQSTSRAVNVSSKVQSNQSNSSASSRRVPLLGLVQETDEDVTYNTMSEYMETQADNCELSGNFPDENSFSEMSLDSGFLKNNNIRIAGKGCPIDIKLSFNTDTDNQSYFKLNFDGSYNAVDPVFAKMNDVTSFEAAGSVNITGSQNSGKADMGLVGKIVSKSQGTIRIDGSGSVTGNDKGESKGEFTVNLRYKDFVAQFVTKVDGEKATTYLNGEEIDVSKEFDDLDFSSETSTSGDMGQENGDVDTTTVDWKHSALKALKVLN